MNNMTTKDKKMWKETFKHNNDKIIKEEYKWGWLMTNGQITLKYRNETKETFCYNPKTKNWDKWSSLNPNFENWTDSKQLKYNL